MNVAPISEKTIKPDFQARKKKDQDFDATVEKQEETYTKSKVNGMVLATALSAAVLGGAVMHGHGKWKISNLKKDNETIKNTLTKAEEKVKNLTKDNETLSSINKRLQEEAQKAKDRLTDIFEGDIAPKDMRDKIFNELKTKIEKGGYGYDIAQPPVTGKGGAKVYNDAIPLLSELKIVQA